MSKVVNKVGQIKNNNDVKSNCTDIMHLDSFPFTTNTTSNYQDKTLESK